MTIAIRLGLHCNPMSIHLWGTDFHRASHDLRGKLFLPLEERDRRLKEWISFGFRDLVYLHTCNRVEFYTTARDHFCDTRHLWRALLASLGLSPDDYYKGYHLEGKSALRHLLRVACSLESLVVGEPQILGQLKEAYQWTKQQLLDPGSSMEPHLERCFQTAFETAKKVRTETSLGKSRVSVASLGLQRFEAMERDFPLKRVVVIGRSPMSLCVLRWFIEHRPAVEILWVNRTVESLGNYPESRRVNCLSLAEFLSNPPDFSHLFTATASEVPFIDSPFLKGLGDFPRVFFDFAEPPDIERVGSIHRIIGIEDLGEESRTHAISRSQSVEVAEHVIELSLKQFYLELKQAPLLRNFSQIEPKCVEELQRAVSDLREELPPDVCVRIERWAQKLVKKNIHISRAHLATVLDRAIESEPCPPQSL